MSPAREALSRVLPRPKSPQETCSLLTSQTLQAPLSFPCGGDEPCFPEIQSGTAQSFNLSLSPSRLLSFVFVVTQSASASPSVRRLSGRIYSVPRSSQLLCRQKKRPCLMAFFRLGFFSLVVVLFLPLSLGLILFHFSDLIGI